MGNVFQAAKLDGSLVRPYGKTLCFVLLFPLVFAAINRSLLTGVSFAMCFMAMTASYPFSIGEQNGMERLYGMLPVRRRELVFGRYLFTLIQGALALAVSLLLQPLALFALGEAVGPGEVLFSAAAGVFLYALYTAFQLPGYYKYGSIKGRLFLWVPVAGFLVTLFFFPRLSQTAANALKGAALATVVLGALALSALLYGASAWCSARIMERKEL